MDFSKDILDVDFPPQEESIIKIFGIGGGGSNAVNYMYRQGIKGVDFIVCNTDIQALRISPVKNCIQLGKDIAEGLGAGCAPDKGRASALESLDYISSLLEHNTKMIFITAGMGGGTGTGATPVIARRARELGILTIAIVTLPFSFEGRKKIEQAMNGIDELEDYVDALLIINNEKLRDMCGDLKLSEAFAMADSVLTTAAKSIAEIITKKGYVNVDFADVEGVMRNSGVALMGSAEVEGENRAKEAIKRALISPLLNSQDIRGARNILLNMLYEDVEVTPNEMEEITDYLRTRVGRNVNIIWGAGKDENLGAKLRVSVIVTGFNTSSRFIGMKAMEDMPKVSDVSREKPDLKEEISKPDFKVEDLPEDLEMIFVDTKEVEDRARHRRKKDEKTRKSVRTEEERSLSDSMEEGSGGMLFPVEKGRAFTQKKEPPSGGVNDIPDTDGWLRRKLGGFFKEDTDKDPEM